MKTLKIWVAAATMMALSGTAQATLINRGGGMIFDPTRNITWLADMNYAFTSGYAAANAGGTGSNRILTNGQMGWDAAVAWADQLVYGGFDDWRLPTLNPADTTCSESFIFGGFTLFRGFGCTGGELSGLFVADLGNKALESVLNQVGDTAEQIANLALFSNVQSSFYWSGTESAQDPCCAWYFGTLDGPDGGLQGTAGKFVPLYAVAVRPGDVTAAVPEPQSLALVLMGLGATVVARRTRSR